MKNIIIIPSDPRYPLDKKPLVTNEMKAECIGEFNIPVDLVCECGGCEPEGCEVCGGEGTYIYNVQVPWTTVKDIYKKMATVASRLNSR